MGLVQIVISRERVRAGKKKNPLLIPKWTFPLLQIIIVCLKLIITNAQNLARPKLIYSMVILWSSVFLGTSQFEKSTLFFLFGAVGRGASKKKKDIIINWARPQ